MYHGSSSESHQWGSWSAWVFNEQQSRYYRFRQDSEGVKTLPALEISHHHRQHLHVYLLGNYDYDWDQHGSAPTAHAQTPRDTTISDITEGLRGLTTDYNGSSAFYPPAYRVALVAPARASLEHRLATMSGMLIIGD